VKTIVHIGHIRAGVIARYSRANGFKLAICVGFGRDSRPRARLYRATAGAWTNPELVDPAHLVPLGKIEIEGPSRQHTVLTRALEGLWTTPELGFGLAHVALLVVGAAGPAIPALTGSTEPGRQGMLASYMDLTGHGGSPPAGDVHGRFTTRGGLRRLPGS
jgi:hypothetical protein